MLDSLTPEPSPPAAEDGPDSWWVYIIRTEDDRLYTGVTTDVDRRFREHCAQGTRSARYLRAHRPRAVVFRQRVGSRSLAQQVEWRLKQLSRAQKEAVIQAGTVTYDAESGRIVVA